MLSPFECLCGNFILPEPASYVFFYAIFNLRKLFYLIASGMEMLARSVAAFRAATRLASASTTRCCAAVGGSAALRMRHTPCGCRSACLIEVRSNFRLPRHCSMRRAQQCRYFASSLPPSKRHSRLTTVRRGCCQVATRRDSWRSHVHRTRLRSACSHSSYRLPMPGVEGPSPRLSLGDSKGVFSSEREYPLWCRGAHAAPPPALARENQGTPLEKGVKKTRHICGRSFSELISNNACCGSYGRPRSSCGA